MANHICLIAHNLRSSHNVGSLLRTAEALGLDTVYLTGYTPYPKLPGDKRLPHEAHKIHAQIQKTALGAEKLLNIKQSPDVRTVIKSLHDAGYALCALEQDPRSIPLADFQLKKPIALIVGREVEGIEADLLEKVDTIIEIPLAGQKESLNVVQAAAIALYQLTLTLS